jgi:hypothetical protein
VINGNSENFHKWINTLILSVCGALLGVIWFMLQAQIAVLGIQISDLRADTRVSSTQAADLRGEVKGLDQRVKDLVDTINRNRR